MYCVDQELLVELDGIPQSSVGSPEPVVISDQHLTFLVYVIEDEPKWDGRVLSESDLSLFIERVALVEFQRCRTYSFGFPNDEAIQAHPLYALGLKPYSAFEVQKSSWLSQLEQMNSVHPRHKPDSFESLHHYVFTFHDSTFECLAERYQVTEHQKSMRELVQEVKTRLFV
jgi:hypothetical protein